MGAAHYREPGAISTIRDRVINSGLRGRQLGAAVEEAALAAALRSRAAGTPAMPVHVPVTGGDDLDIDSAFLGQVADAYRRQRAYM